MTELRLEEVSYKYGIGTPFEKDALDSVSCSFSPGKITGIIGHTGSGKSTLAQLLNGLNKPHSGRVLINGKDIWEDKKEIVKIRFKVGLVFQYPEYQLFEESVYADIAFGPKNMGKGAEEVDLLVRSAASFAGVDEELLQKSPFELSGGQKRRVAIAGVMAMDPEVIVFDEPAAGLDPGSREAIFKGIREYQRQKEKTVIIISHSMEDMAKYADELIVLKNGKILCSGSVAEVFSQSDLIHSSGLGLPWVTSFMKKLSELGVDVDCGVYTAEDAYNQIVSRI